MRRFALLFSFFAVHITSAGAQSAIASLPPAEQEIANISREEW